MNTQTLTILVAVITCVLGVIRPMVSSKSFFGLWPMSDKAAQLLAMAVFGLAGALASVANGDAWYMWLLAFAAGAASGGAAGAASLAAHK